MIEEECELLKELSEFLLKPEYTRKNQIIIVL